MSLKKLELEVQIAKIKAGMLEQQYRVAQKEDEISKIRESISISLREIERKEKELITME